MRYDRRLSRMLHMRVHMARRGGPVTSERVPEREIRKSSGEDGYALS